MALPTLNTFSPNTTALSADVNTNFTNLKNRQTIEGDNNVAVVQSENTSAVVKDLLTLNASNVIKLGQMARQGGSASSWNSSGTTNYTADAWTIQAGRVNINGSSTVTITFPLAFSDAPIVVCTPYTANDVNITISNTTNVSATQATFVNHDASARALTWIAIGPVA